jgi:signal transduction histidine kinase
MLLIVGALAVVLVLSALWITQLQRKVEQRGAALEKEIRARQQVEQQHVIEQERARVAQDLHDELGSDLTEVGMLLARAQSAAAPSERRAQYLEQTAAKARQMVTALDEIVWAMNPRHDSLGSLTSYFCLHADRFLSLAGITWRLEHAVGATDLALDSRRRHQLFLAFKEALTNVVRHAQATEVRFSLRVEAGEVCLTVTDNGRGLPATSPGAGMDGMANLRARCEKLGGHFEIRSEPGGGTTVRFSVPAN